MLVPLIGACTANPAHPPTLVATTTVLGSIAGPIAECGGGTYEVLMPAGADPHDFSPSSAQLARLEDASLVVVNGLGLEAGLADALAAAETDGAHVLEIGPAVDPVRMGGSEDPSAAFDPHVWFDMTRMATAAELIGRSLADATGNEAYVACGTQEAEGIRASEERVRTMLASVPEADRVLVTDHDALGYLARAYDYRVAGTVVPSSTTLAEPSSADLAALGDQLRAEGVRAIFSNVAQPSALSKAVAADAGSDVTVVPLLVESVGAPGTAAGTYTGMLESDARAIATSLGGQG